MVSFWGGAYLQVCCLVFLVKETAVPQVELTEVRVNNLSQGVFRLTYLCEPKRPVPDACSSLTGSWVGTKQGCKRAGHVHTGRLPKDVPDAPDLMLRGLNA